MKALKSIFTILLIFYTIPTLLAGLDIYNGTEPDLSSEWIIVFIFFIMFLGLITINIIEIVKMRVK